MIVPQYWAEARQQHRQGQRQITVRRFGWSDESQAAAQQHADARASEAMARLQAGEVLDRRERKVAYNGAEGVPIREEIVRREGDTVITRNSYGALCLNTANVLFADVDFEQTVAGRGIIVAMLVAIAGAIAAGLAGIGWGWAFALMVAGLLFAYPLAQTVFRLWLSLTGGVEQRTRKRIQAFSAAHPQWHLRLYRTPAGFRVLVMHALFDPVTEAVDDFFNALGTDPIYQQMCLNQRCFRARVSPKPWRIGIGQHLRPRPGVWPIASEHLPARQQWLRDYENKAQGFAACQFVERLGSDVINPTAQAVQRLHDELCKANTKLAIA